MICTPRTAHGDDNSVLCFFETVQITAVAQDMSKKTDAVLRPYWCTIISSRVKDTHAKPVC